jgi:hypothetical protein
VLPHANHHPSRIRQPRIRVGITSPVLLELVSPPLGVALRTQVTIRAAVPEAPVDEHGNSRSREDDVGAPAESRKGSDVNAVAQALTVQSAPQGHLGRGVSRALALEARLDVAAGGNGPVRHGRERASWNDGGVAAQDDAREKQMRDLFNLRVDPDRVRSDTDAFLDREAVEPLPFELKSTTKTSISTVRDFNPDHVRKWKDKHWLFGFFDEHEQLQYCCYASPAIMRPWIEKLEAYVRPDIELAGRLGSRVTDEDLVAILGDKEVYSLSDAASIQKKQWKKQQYFDEMDVPATYSKDALIAALPENVTAEDVVAALGDEPRYLYTEVRAFLKGRWRRAMLEYMDGPPGYTKAKMLEILRLRARYILDRGTTLNNPHISKSFFADFDKITANHAIRVREMVATAEELAAAGVEPAEAAVMEAAAQEALAEETTPAD